MRHRDWSRTFLFTKIPWLLIFILNFNNCGLVEGSPGGQPSGQPSAEPIWCPIVIDEKGRGTFNASDIKAIGTTMFTKNCKDKDLKEMVSISIPSSVEIIESLAFSSSQSRFPTLKTVDLSNATSLTLIGYRAFFTMTISGVDFENATSLRQIGMQAFHMSHLTDATFPPSLTHLNDSAFYKCKSLKWVDMSLTKVESIGESCFKFCSSLSDV